MRMRSLTLALAILVAVIVVVAVPTGQASANGGGVHCVRYGETLYGIAWQYGTSVQAISHANGIWNPNYVRAGMCLRIPSGYGNGNWNGGYGNNGYGNNGYGHDTGYDNGWNKGYGQNNGYVNWGGGYGKPGYGQGRMHCVKYGETLSGIAWMYGSSTWAIANANGINPNWIRAGQCLTIPGY